MKIQKKLMHNTQELIDYGPINIVIFGDSVSHGAFNGYIDYDKVYWNLLRKKLNSFRSYIPVNMICASIGGTTATRSLSRLDEQVLVHKPDLVIVSFGLNDVNGPLEDYLTSLECIFTKCKYAGSEVIFMTPNMLNTYVADGTAEKHLNYAAKTAEIQNGGKMDRYMAAATDLAKGLGITVCDCYSKWKELAKTEDTTMLLANKINHPTPEMHNLFADSLYDIIMSEETSGGEDCSTMFSK